MIMPGSFLARDSRHRRPATAHQPLNPTWPDDTLTLRRPARADPPAGRVPDGRTGPPPGPVLTGPGSTIV
jgi:hypothetical protein